MQKILTELKPIVHQAFELIALERYEEAIARCENLLQIEPNFALAIALESLALGCLENKEALVAFISRFDEETTATAEAYLRQFSSPPEPNIDIDAFIDNIRPRSPSA